jgi:hypothetical protein
MATTIDECVEMVKQVQASKEQKIFGVGHGMSPSITLSVIHADLQCCDTRHTTGLSSKSLILGHWERSSISKYVLT